MNKRIGIRSNSLYIPGYYIPKEKSSDSSIKSINYGTSYRTKKELIYGFDNITVFKFKLNNNLISSKSLHSLKKKK